MSTGLLKTLNYLRRVHRIDEQHGERTAVLSLAIGKRLNGGERLNAEKLEWLDIAATLHDIGSSLIPGNIMRKGGRLEVWEQAAVRSHPLIGYDLLVDSGLPVDVLYTIKYHHEHWDGTGYPEGRIGMDIPLFPRIVCITDSWDGIISKRPYHPARTPEETLEIMNQNVNWFDPKLYAIFLAILREQNERR